MKMLSQQGTNHPTHCLNYQSDYSPLIKGTLLMNVKMINCLGIRLH